MIKRLSIILVGIVAMLLLLSGCSVLRESAVDEEKETEQMAQSIITAIDNRDEEKLRNVLSPSAVLEAYDLNEGSRYTNELYEGIFVSYEKKGIAYGDHFGQPGRTKYAEAHYIVTTSEDTYILYFLYWIIEDANPSAQGVYRIKLAKYTDAESDESFNYGNYYNRPGIYHPGWDVQPDSAV
jgi:hypothetical protein